MSNEHDEYRRIWGSHPPLNQYPGLKRVTVCWKCKNEAPKGEDCPSCGAYNGAGK
jgi:hypothetical protein